ncbi:hypothetical protein AWW67_07465 [Roseivirga seohaensis]|uniref:Uncharacterized protein n=1 Tax=Roseivirga seohaensis TaxID=1914963 RepID=A0A150XQZ8_9BACT|nr:hypothetical protein [Roseivirga seohaensis]KYG81188.1 hypothetical protein AWW67_07465 [Roseivirga seohaensis]
MNSRQKLLAIGSPIKPKLKGSTSYYVKEFKSNEEALFPKDILKRKAIFEIYTKGLLIHTFYISNSIAIPIPFEEIKSIHLVRGEERITPIPFSLMWILLKFKVRIQIARNFRLRYSEYYIAETELKIETSSFSALLISGGYTFEGQEKFFNKIKSNIKLTITK